MGKYNVLTSQVEATSRKEWLRNRRTQKASISIGSAGSAGGFSQQQSPAGGGATSISELNDVLLSNLENDNLLVFTDGKWINVQKDDFLAGIGGGDGEAAGVVTLEKSSDGLTYTLKQDGILVGKIEIPKSGDYSAEQNAAQIQITVDNNNRIISARIVSGSVDTEKIADKAVTTAKLAAGIQTTLEGAISPSTVFVDGAGNQASNYLKKEAAGKNGVIIYTKVTTIESDTNGLADSKNVKAYVDKATSGLSALGWRVMRGNGGSDQEYWNKVAHVDISESISSAGREAWIEVEASGDTNFPYSARFTLQIARYENRSVSISTFGGAIPYGEWNTVLMPMATVDSNGDVWLKLHNCNWDQYAAIRPIKEDTTGNITILGSVVDDSDHADNFVTRLDNPASIYIDGYGSLRFDISANDYSARGAIIPAKADDSDRLGGVGHEQYTMKDDFKTINGQNIVGSGDITISGGGGGIQTYTPPFDVQGLLTGEINKLVPQEIDELRAAIESNKLLIIPYSANGGGYSMSTFALVDDFIYLIFSADAAHYYAEIDYTSGDIVTLNQIG